MRPLILFAKFDAKILSKNCKKKKKKILVICDQKKENKFKNFQCNIFGAV